MKKIFFALLSASMVLFAACQPAGPEVSDEAQVIEARDASYEVTVTSTGAWTLEGEYDWMTPSATKGNGGEKITFTARVNLTELIRTAEYTLKQNGGETVITLYQKGIAPDASVSISLVEKTETDARFALSYSTAIEADYKEYGIYYNTEPNIETATRVVKGTDMAAGVKVVDLEGLTAGKVYFVWPYVQTIDVVEVVGGMIGLLEPKTVSDINELQKVIDAAEEYQEVRVVAGTYSTAVNGILQLRNNVTVSGGWNAEFTAQEGYTVIDGQQVKTCVNIADDVKGATIKNLELINTDNNAKGAVTTYGADATIVNCYVHDNKLGGDCGAVYIGGGNAAVANCRVVKNEANGHGTGVFAASGSNVKVVNCLIAENLSSKTGGYYGGLILKGGCGVVVNNTIVKNRCYDETGQSWPNNGNRDGGWVKAYNNVIAGNLARIKTTEEWTIQRDQWYFQTWDGNCEFQNNLIQGGKKGGISDGEWDKNIVVVRDYDLSTLFTDYENGDYTLKAGAACVDKGNGSNANVAGLIGVYNTDLAGKPRVKGTVDCGCYEIQ